MVYSLGVVGILFADDIVGVSGSKEGLISVVDGYSNKWRECSVVFSRNPAEGEWKWGEHVLPSDFTCNGDWDVHIGKVHDNGNKKRNQLHSVISNRDINLTVWHLLLLS